MSVDVVLDTVQTASLIIVATVLSATFLMLRREFLRAGQTLRQVLESQQKLLDDQQAQIEELGRVWVRTQENTTAIRALQAEIATLRRP